MSKDVNLASDRPISLACMPCRKFLIGAGAAGMALGAASGRAYTQITTAPDYSLRIAPLRLELAPGKVIETFAYNGTVPGPVLRLREGRQVSIDIRNDTDVDDIIHWHGLYRACQTADGAMEEGSPMVPSAAARSVYTFAPKPTGTRWYHSHDVAGTDLRRSLYSGMYGFLIIEPASDPGRYDQEVLLAAHHWEGTWVSMQDIRTGPPPDNGLEVHVRVGILQRQDARPRRAHPRPRRRARAVSPAQCQRDPEHHAGAPRPPLHRDSARRQSGAFAPSVDTLFLAPAERADVIVEMNRPGVWILGERQR